LQILAMDLGIHDDSIDKIKLISMPTQEAVKYIYELALNQQRIPDSLSINEFQHRFDIFKANYHALANYKPTPYSGELVVLKATEDLEQHIGAPDDLGWSDLAEVKYHGKLPGSHFDIVKNPAVKQLADAIKKHLHVN